MPAVAVTPGAIFTPTACSQTGPPVPGIPWFTISGKAVVVTGNTFPTACPGPSVGVATVIGGSHWTVNGLALVRLGLDSAPSLSVLALSGQGADYFSA
jgi:uncharacterized Zn-binding protein involved in type VI secretion